MEGSLHIPRGIGPSSGPAPTVYGIDLGLPLDRRRVLVGDPSPFHRKALTRFLHWAGITQITFAADGTEVLAAVERVKPDLMVLDTHLPAPDGIALCRELRRQARWRDVPILMQSAVNSDQLRTLCFQAGATDIIAKPVNPGECISRVRYHLERRAMVEELRAFRERVERELLQARSMQQALLPEPERLAGLAGRQGLSVDPVFRSSAEIGGDFWTMFEIDARRAGVFVADLSGHGIAAAINAFRLHTLLTRLPGDALHDPARLLAHLNQRLCEILPVGQFATAFYGIIDRGADTLHYASAGAPGPVLADAAGVRALDGSGLFLGAFAGVEYENRRAPLPSGAGLFLYSDGLVEACDAAGAMLGEEGLLHRLRAAIAAAPQRPLPLLLDDVHRTHGTGITDDLTALWIARH